MHRDAVQRAPADDAARRKALHPNVSFLVQAPAGSGKTELLIRRYLALLAQVDQPESILAITFTRKAAAQMRNRVLGAMERAQREEQPRDDQDRETLALASAALKQNQSLAWSLLEAPSRLRILTIDAFCSQLAQRMPYLSRLGALPEIVEDASELYQEAALETIALIDGEDPCASQVLTLLRHLDNSVERAQQMIAAMLARRDQWLPLFGALTSPSDLETARQALEANLHWLIDHHLERLRSAVGEDLLARLSALAGAASHNLNADGGPNPMAAWLERSGPLEAAAKDLPRWQALATMLLNNRNEWRKKVNKNQGFPPGAAEKKKIQGVLDNELPKLENFRQLLVEAQLLPPPRYTEAQWSAMKAFLGLLPAAVMQLKLTFQRRGQADFTEISLAALEALGTRQEPADLALALGDRIDHILIDEFQDTSEMQMELLRRLTWGWDADDSSKTLFVVGDPMQSIYRFRQAEVGLFIQAREQGVGGLKLEPLQLEVNFRSQPEVVGWINRVFAQVFPSREDLVTGAVVFARSSAYREPEPGSAVQVHGLADATPHEEARRVVEILQDARNRRPGDRVAILVRARTHLPEILQELKKAGISYRAIDIDSLGDRPEVRHILALMRALLHPADRTSWLAVLRAPWCGLTLADLCALIGHDRHSTIPELIESPAAAISEDGRRRLARLREALMPMFSLRGRLPVYRLVEAAWLRLAGPSLLRTPEEAQNVQRCLALIAEQEEGGDVAALDRLERAIAQLYALPDPSGDDRLEILTIHKAKGLEWDIVIVPGLHRRPQRDSSTLVNWLQAPSSEGMRLIAAPVSPFAAAQKDPAHVYLNYLAARKAAEEEVRLLYVAATRAKRELHLVGSVKSLSEGESGTVRDPDSGSFLAHLWPQIRDEFIKSIQLTKKNIATSEIDQTSVLPPPAIRRVPTKFSPPAPPAGCRWERTGPEESVSREQQQVTYDWVGETLRLVGIAVHAWLRRIAVEGVENWSKERVRSLETHCERILLNLGVSQAELQAATTTTLKALENALIDPRGRWILAQRPDAGSEWPLSAVFEGEVRHMVIDRTFTEDGVRWIIDYKTSYHEGGALEHFLNEEVRRHRQQMEQYAAALGRHEGKPIRIGLYFPLLKAWREWSPGGDA